MTIWGAYQTLRLRSNLRQMAADLDQEMEAVYRQQVRGLWVAALRIHKRKGSAFCWADCDYAIGQAVARGSEQ